MEVQEMIECHVVVSVVSMSSTMIALRDFAHHVGFDVDVHRMTIGPKS
jgi:hypothetical protein